ITAQCATRDRKLCIGSENSGLWRLHDGIFDHFQEADGLVNNKVRCLLETREGSLWIGTEGGLSRFKNSNFTNFTTKNGLAHNGVRALCEDKEGNVRAATARGLSRIEADGKVSTINIGTNATANSLKGVCVDGKGRIWVSSPEGITCLDGAGVSPALFSDGIFGAEKVRTDPGQFFGAKEGLPSPIATALLADGSEGV